MGYLNTKPDPYSIDEELEQRKQELEVQANAKRERQRKLDQATTGVKFAELLLTQLDQRVAGARVRIDTLKSTILNLAESSGNPYAGNNPDGLMLEAYASIAALTALVSDQDRVREYLSNKLVDAQLSLKNATK